jgi:hypothetical protein
MIHILEKKLTGHNPADNSLLHYVELSDLIDNSLSKNNVIHTVINNNTYLDYFYLNEYINNNNISLLVLNLEIIKNFQNESIDVIKLLSEKYSNVKFIVSSFETYPTINSSELNISNVFWIVNGVHNLTNFDKLNEYNLANYYMMNLYSQNLYNTFIHKLFHYISTMRRNKKYNFFNGIHKPHRIKCYEIIKKNNLLNEGYFSYLDFAKFVNDEHQYDIFANFLEFEKQIDYLNYISDFEIPYLCDTYEVSQNIFVPFSIPPQYSFQSYINITT